MPPRLSWQPGYGSSGCRGWLETACSTWDVRETPTALDGRGRFSLHAKSRAKLVIRTGHFRLVCILEQGRDWQSAAGRAPFATKARKCMRRRGDFFAVVRLRKDATCGFMCGRTKATRDCHLLWRQIERAEMHFLDFVAGRGFEAAERVGGCPVDGHEGHIFEPFSSGGILLRCGARLYGAAFGRQRTCVLGYSACLQRSRVGRTAPSREADSSTVQPIASAMRGAQSSIISSMVISYV